MIIGVPISATKNFTLTETFAPVASGAGSVTFQGFDWDVDWSIISNISPAGIAAWQQARKGKEESLSLVAGEYLHLRGKGLCAVTADVVI